MEPGRPRPPRGHQATGGPGRNVRRGPHHHLTCRGGASALARLQPRVDAVDHVNATPAADYYRTRAQLEGPDRAPDLHGVSSQTRFATSRTAAAFRRSVAAPVASVASTPPARRRASVVCQGT